MDQESTSHDSTGVPYILVHSDREIGRLSHQAGIVNPITRRIFLAAGLTSGMRVLDVGCGGGDVTFLVSEIVGNNGQVVGVDRAPAALAAARSRLTSHPIQNVSFREGDPSERNFEQQFDAVVGRYVLIFQTDPAATLRGITRHIRPGGVVVFHEPDWDGSRSKPQAPTYDLCCQWIVETFRRTGIETNMGIKLRAAGLADPSMHLESVVGGTIGGLAWAHQVAELIFTMQPEIYGRGVPTPAEVDVKGTDRPLVRSVTSIDAACYKSPFI